MSTPKRFKTKVQQKRTKICNSISVKINPCLYLYTSIKFTPYTAMKKIKGSTMNYKISIK